MTVDALWCLEHQPDVASYVITVAELLADSAHDTAEQAIRSHQRARPRSR